MNKKYWYFVAEIGLFRGVVKYDGYVMHNDEFFPVNTAKLQAVERGQIDFENSKGDKSLMRITTIVNQVEVSETEFETWRETNKL